MSNKINILVILFISFLVNLSHAVDWVSKTYSTVTIKDTTKLPDGSIYSNFEQTGQGTSNLGKYVISNCSGNRLDKKGKLVEITVFCKVEVDDGNKYWTKLKRTTGDSDAGVSKFKFLRDISFFPRFSFGPTIISLLSEFILITYNGSLSEILIPFL